MADVFISYSSENKDAANAICHVLEENGVRCWIAPRDILQGFDYGDVIEKAIRSCKLFVLVYSKTAAVSPWVKGEVNIAFTEGKTILPYRIDETLLEGGLRVMLNQYHWIDSYPDYKRCFKDLLTSVEANLGQTEKQIISPKPQPVQDNEPTQRETEVDTVCEDRQMISDIKSKLGKAQTDEIIKQPDTDPKPNYTKYILGALVVALGVIVGIWLGNRETTPPEPIVEDVVADIIYEEPTASVEPVTIDSAAISQQAVAEYKKQEEATKRSGTIAGHEYVDLGLSVKWATCNVGANAPHGYGNYYAWGETSTKNSYDKDNSRTYGVNMSDINGNSSYDAARANWGGSWRMPTEAEMDELYDKCTWTWTSQSGIGGCNVTGPNGNSIFLPAAGYCYGSSRIGVGEVGYYWSSTPVESGTIRAYILYFYSGYRNADWSYRFGGRSVRPVSE